MRRPEWEEAQNPLTERQILERLLIMVDAEKRSVSRNASGLVPAPGEEKTWQRWEQCGNWLRNRLQNLEARRLA